jgi:hypothetical protein
MDVHAKALIVIDATDRRRKSSTRLTVPFVPPRPRESRDARDRMVPDIEVRLYARCGPDRQRCDFD